MFLYIIFFDIVINKYFLWTAHNKTYYKYIYTADSYFCLYGRSEFSKTSGMGSHTSPDGIPRRN